MYKYKYYHDMIVRDVDDKLSSSKSTDCSNIFRIFSSLSLDKLIFKEHVVEVE